MKPVAVALSVFIGVGGCGCPIDFSMCLIGTAMVALWKIPATSASEEEDTTCRSVLHSTCIAALSFGLLVLFG